MQRVIVATACACTALVVAGCNHYRTPIPGVLDLRSDGSDAPVSSTKLAPDAQRTGIDALMKGDGATGDVEVKLHDRAVWALRLIYLGDGAQPEFASAMPGRSALRNVVVGEEMSVFDVALYACTMPIPCIDVGTVALLPTYSFVASGTRIALDELERPDAAPADAPGDAPAEVPAAPESAPTPPAAAPTPAPPAAAPAPAAAKKPAPTPTPTLDRAPQ